MTNKYRVTTNGECFRIEWLFIGFLSKKEKWYPYDNFFYINLKEANKTLDRLNLLDKRQNDTWKPVEK